MQFSKIFSVLVATLFAGQALANPIASAETNLNAVVDERKRDTNSVQALGNAYLCLDDNFRGTCTNIASGKNECIALTNTWRYGVSSFGPDKNTWCVLYHCTDCSCQGSEGFTSPGKSSMGEYNDNVGSYKCWW